MTTPAIAAALYAVKQAGRSIDLQDRIASAWSEARERKLSRSIGAAGDLAMDLQHFLKISREQADEAAERFFNPDYSQVAINTLLAFAKELSAPQPAQSNSRIRPIEEVRRTWNPGNGGLSEEELHPERYAKPAIRRPAARKPGGLVA